MRLLFLSLSAALLSGTAAAQPTNPLPPPTEFSIEFKLAPRMTLARPDSAADYTDATTTSVNFKVKQQLAEGLAGTFSFGRSISFDDDKDPPGTSR